MKFKEFMLIMESKYHYIFMADKAVVIPVAHSVTIPIPDKKNLVHIKDIAKNFGYWFEGCGEKCEEGEGSERNFVKNIGVPEAKNHGSYDDRVKLGQYAGYTFFASLDTNKDTVNRLESINGETVKDIILSALARGIATFQDEKLTLQQANNVINIMEESGLDTNQPRKELYDILRKGEEIMWGGGHPDMSSNTPLGDYAWKANEMRRNNVKKLANQIGGVFFMGQDHIPAF